jgi:hypothetical protein
MSVHLDLVRVDSVCAANVTLACRLLDSPFYRLTCMIVASTGLELPCAGYLYFG